MRQLKKFSGVLRFVGVVLVALSLVLLIYSTTTDRTEWAKFRQQLLQKGVQPNIVDRFTFSKAYYGALASARDTVSTPGMTRVTAITGHFASFSKRVKALEQEAFDQTTREVEDYIINQFDHEEFLRRFELMEDRMSIAELREIFAYIDGLSTPALKSGKVLPSMKPASSQPWFKEHHDSLLETHGEEKAGSFLEYMNTVKRLIEEKGDVTNGRDFASALAFSDYEAELEKTRNAEKAEAAALFLDGFSDLSALKVKGEAADFPAFLKGEYEKVSGRFAASAVPPYAMFLNAAREALNNPTFDGSYSTLASMMRDEQSAYATSQFDTFLRNFSQDIVTNSDSWRNVALSTVLWTLAANTLLIGLIGILMILFSYVLARVTSTAIIKRREYNTRQDDPDVLLRVDHLSQYFKSGDYVNKAVDDVSFYIKRGEVFGLVGESGCGKTTTGRTIINLYDPTGGDVYFEGLRISSTKNGAAVMRYQKRRELEAQIKGIEADSKERQAQDPGKAAEIKQQSDAKIAGLRQQHAREMEQVLIHAFESDEEKNKCEMLYRDQRREELTREYEEEIKSLTGDAAKKRTERYKTDMALVKNDNVMTKVQMIFQDPIASINPRMTVREIIAEGLIIRGVRDKELINKKVYEMLDLVGLVPEHADRYPHEFSGGQRQRIGIARAIVLEPDLIIADEPISALDVSIQAQIINLLNDLRKRMGLTIMFIAHNLSVVKYFSDRIAVMYYGRIVEMAPSEELFRYPLHPYTKSLLSAIPYPDPQFEKQRKRIEYEPVLAHDYSVDKPSLHEISPGHFIHANEAELAQYRKDMGL